MRVSDDAAQVSHRPAATDSEKGRNGRRNVASRGGRGETVTKGVGVGEGGFLDQNGTVPIDGCAAPRGRFQSFEGGFAVHSCIRERNMRPCSSTKTTRPTKCLRFAHFSGNSFALQLLLSSGRISRSFSDVSRKFNPPLATDCGP